MQASFIDAVRRTVKSNTLAMESAAGPGMEREYVFFGAMTDPSQLSRADRYEDQEQWRIQVPATEPDREIWVRIRKTVRFYRHGTSTDFGQKDPEYTLTIKSYIKGEPDTVEAESELPPQAGEAMLATFRANGNGMIKRRYFFRAANPKNPNEPYFWEVDAFWRQGVPDPAHVEWVKLDLEVKDYDLALTANSFELPFPVDLREVVYRQPHDRNPADAAKVREILKTYMTA